MSKYNLNKTILQGNLVRDTELKHSKQGNPYCRFSVAVNEGEKVNYFDVACFGKLAESLSQYLTKGTAVIVVAKLNQDTTTDDNGVKRNSIGIIANEIFLIGGGNRKRDEY